MRSSPPQAEFFLGTRSPNYVFVKKIKHENRPPQADFFKDLAVQHVFFVKEIEHLGGSNPENFPPAAGILPQIYPLYHFKNRENLLYH